MTRRPLALAPVLAVTLAAAGGAARLEVRHVPLDLPGPPAAIVPADLDGDGRNELAVVVAYTEVESIGEDRIEDLVQISVVIPALFDRRELLVYSTAGDVPHLLAPPLALPPSVLHVEPGPPGAALLALTDEGLSRIVLRGEGDDRTIALESIVALRPVLAGSKSFQARLRIVHDVDGDGVGDVLFPGEDGLAIHVWRDGRPRAVGGAPLRIAGDATETLDGVVRRHPFPDVRDIDGDGHPDLVARDGAVWHVLLGRGDGTFVPLREEPRDCHDRGTDVRIAGLAPGLDPWPRGLVALRDVDGDGRAEAIVTEELERSGDGLRASLAEVRRPRVRYSAHRLDAAGDVVPEPYTTFVAEGHDLSGGGGELPAAAAPFLDLDADGREDLVTMTLDFSMFQAVRVLATRKISIGTDFHVFRQSEDGSFGEVEGLDLSETLKFDLSALSLGRFAQFAGDFDGDGRPDFVHLGRGRRVTIHRGAAGARYPKKPDLVIELAEEPGGLELVRIEDLDGDGRSDLRVTRPLVSTDPDVTAPVRLDLYLSGTAR